MNSKIYSLSLCCAFVTVIFLAVSTLSIFSMGNTITGSAAVFVWTPQQAFLATDSKQTDPEQPGIFEDTCKMLITPRFAFTSTGFSELRSVRFSVKATAAEVDDKVGIPREIVDSFEKLLAPRLEQALEFARLHVPEVYSRQYQNRIVMNGLFAFPTDPPTIIVTRFRSNDSTGRIRLEHQRYECPGSTGCPRMRHTVFLSI